MSPDTQVPLGIRSKALPWSEEKATQRADGTLEGVEQSLREDGGTGVCQKERGAVGTFRSLPSTEGPPRGH